MRGSVETLGALMHAMVHKSSGGTTRQGNPSEFPLVTTIKADLMSRHVPLLRWTQASTAKLDAAAVQFRRDRGIAIYREADGKRVRASQDSTDSG